MEIKTMPSAWQVFQKYMGGLGNTSKDMGGMWNDTGVEERSKTLVGAEQGTTAEIASRLREKDLNKVRLIMRLHSHYKLDCTKKWSRAAQTGASFGVGS
jgi:hypothetical protein